MFFVLSAPLSSSLLLLTMARIVRKQSLISRLRAYPLDLLLSLNEQRELIDWDAHSQTIALPLGFGLTVLYFLVRLWQDYSPVEAKPKYFDYNNEILRGSKYFAEEPESPLSTKFLQFLQFITISINVINTTAFLFKTKKYAIFNKDNLPRHTTSARKISRSLDLGSEQRSTFRSIITWVFGSETNDVDSYWELTMWNPSKFSTYLFVSFPPFNVAFLYLSQSSFINLSFVISTSFVLYFVIIRGYMILISDKQLLYQETFDEYERKFVRPKLSIAKREVAVDATQGPYNGDSINYYSPGRTEKVFVTHDKKGRESIEKFEHGEFSPLRRSTSDDLRRNVFTPKKKRVSMPYNPSPLSRKSYKF